MGTCNSCKCDGTVKQANIDEISLVVGDATTSVPVKKSAMKNNSRSKNITKEDSLEAIPQTEEQAYKKKQPRFTGGTGTASSLEATADGTITGGLNSKSKDSYEKSNITYEASKQQQQQQQHKVAQTSSQDVAFGSLRTPVQVLFKPAHEDNLPEDLDLIKETLLTDRRIRLQPILMKMGSVYSGEWRSGQRDGVGKHTWADGSFYEGSWTEDKANGFGKLVHIDGDIYEGQWVGDMANGNGTYIHKEGAKYVGSWKDDLQHGRGVEIWPDGARYEGEYKQGKISGSGELIFADGSQYKGEFKSNEIDGFGEYNWKDGKVYRGEWKSNKMDGEGVTVWLDKRRYKGTYKDDKKHGYGIFEWTNSKTYAGEWQFGKQHGKGVLSIGEESKEGIWESGKRVMWLT